jgi:asparaginyl-tRNA synthetase
MVGKGCEIRMESLARTEDRYKLFRTRELQKVARIEALLLENARRWLTKNKYTEVIVPHIVSAAGSCEVIDSLFELPYFNKTAYLTQTGQLYLETLVPFLGNVWCCGPSFRAEERADDRHLTEFTLLELEFEGKFDFLLETLESLFSEMMRGTGIKVCLPFKRMKYEEAIETLGLKWGMDMMSSDEQKLISLNDNQPMFITHFPKELKYFNMRVNDDDRRTVNSADFVLPRAGESAGAAEREYNPIKLRQRLTESSMYVNYIARGGSKAAFDWYLRAYEEFDYPAHSGFGMGINRVTKFVLGLSDIRQSTVFPVNSEALY